MSACRPASPRIRLGRRRSRSAGGDVAPDGHTRIAADRHVIAALSIGSPDQWALRRFTTSSSLSTRRPPARTGSHGAVLVGEVAGSSPPRPCRRRAGRAWRLRREHGRNVVVHTERGSRSEPRRGLGRHRHRRDGARFCGRWLLRSYTVQGRGSGRRRTASRSRGPRPAGDVRHAERSRPPSPGRRNGTARVRCCRRAAAHSTAPPLTPMTWPVM
jgi:hypothetical protein